MRRIHFILLLTVLLSFFGGMTQSIQAQALDSWQVYPSYCNATQNIATSTSVYSLCDGNLFRYDIEDGSVKLYDSLGDLSDVNIACMAWSQEAKRLILVYDNGNIDLLDVDDTVLNIASLKDKTIGNKSVVSVVIDGKLAYLCTGFGFLVVDVQQGIVLDTYKLGMNVQGLTISGDTIYLATANGIYCASTESNWHTSGSWKRISTANKITGIVSFDGKVFIMRSDAIRTVSTAGTTVFEQGACTFMRVLSNGKLAIGTSKGVNLYANSKEKQSIPFENNWKDLSQHGSTYWASEGQTGLKAYKLTDNEFAQVEGSIQPNSPVRDLFYRMHYDTDGKGGYRLLVAGGVNTFMPTFYPATAMMYEDGKWTAFDEQTPSVKYPSLNHYNTTDIVQDPNDPSHHFASPYRTGLYEYRDGKFVGLYNSDNSPLRSILPNIEKYYNYVSATCLQYDNEGNLWMCNQETDTIIRVLTNQGKWLALHYKDIEGVPQADGFTFSTSGVNFLCCRRYINRGIFGFYTGGELTNTRSHQHRLISTIVNEDKTSYSPEGFYCATEDLDGRIWCGTDLGLFVIDDPTKFFDDDFTFNQIKIARNDGSGLADYLLNGVSITCIAVDGGNRKWIGTESNGLYLISADGQDMLKHFTAADSPLLSDHVQCIAIHPVTGLVMIGTEAGLCSYMSDATEASEELDHKKVIAYPNPVRPDYSGPIRIEGLTFNAEVKVVSTTGQLIWSGTSNGGTCTWNGCNKQGKRVSSGVYHVIANTESGDKAVVCRIIVIK